MKRLTLFLILLSLGFNLRAEKAFDQVWDRANTAYVNANYDRAIEGYDSIINEGYASYKLYYNIGNAWFKKGEIGKAILNYHRALRLAPSDADIRHNLEVAGAYVKDNIEVVPVFFLKSWTHELRTLFSSNTWAVVSLLMLSLALTCILLYLLSGRLKLRKTGFYAGILFVVLFIASVGFSLASKSETVYSDEAVIMSGAVPVKSSPDNSSKEIFILHEGTKVRIIGSLNQWMEIQIADGNKGWINENALEVI